MKIFNLMLILISTIYFYSCSMPADQQEKKDEQVFTQNNSGKDPNKTGLPEDIQVTADSSKTLPISVGSGAEPNNIKLDNYKVLLAADSTIFTDETCELAIWIGADEQRAYFSGGMAKDSTFIPARIGQYAKITPYAPDFDITPSEMSCVKIDPSGSTVRFILKPRKSGKLKVSANIELYNAECTGIPVPKTTRTLAVNVRINRSKKIKNGVNELTTILWDKFLNFWGVLVVLFFSVLAFLIRKKIKQKTGFDDQKRE